MAKTNTNTMLDDDDTEANLSSGRDDAAALFSRKWKWRIVAVAIIAFLIKATLAWVSSGTQDVGTWEQFVADVQVLGGIALYHKPYTPTSFFNHPPFMLHFVQALGWIADVTGFPVRFCLRLAPSIADVGSAFVLWKIAFNRNKQRNTETGNANRQGVAPKTFSPQAFLLFVGLPTMIGISGFHGNTDPIMMFFVLLSVLLLEGKKPIWMVGLAFGMSLSIKVASLVFVPVFLLFLQTPRRQIEYSICVVATFICSGLPYLVQDPLFILHRVLSYGGQYGTWGISRLLQLAPELREMDSFQHFGKQILLSALILFSLWMNRNVRRSNAHKPDLLRQLALLILLFFTVTPSFATQYLAWVVPLMLALEMPAVVIFYTTSCIYVCFNYAVAWNWYSFHRLPSPLLDQILVSSEILCWLSVVVLFIGETRLLAHENQLSHAAESNASTA